MISDPGVKVVLILGHTPFLASGKTPSSDATASDCIPLIIWEEVSKVNVSLARPRASETTFGLTPPNSIRIAKVCLKSNRVEANSLALFCASKVTTHADVTSPTTPMLILTVEGRESRQYFRLLLVS